MKTEKTIKNILTILISCLSGLAVVRSQGYSVGDNIEDFKYKNSEGKSVSFKDTYAKDKGVILVFTCNTCPYAQAYEQRIIDLHNKYASKGYPVFAINPNLREGDTKEDIQARIKTNKIPYQYVLDNKENPIYKAFDAKKTPEIFLLQRHGSDYRLVYTGTIDDNYEDASAVTKTYIQTVIDELLAEKKLSYTTTKAIGCTIKR